MIKKSLIVIAVLEWGNLCSYEGVEPLHIRSKLRWKVEVHYMSSDLVFCDFVAALGKSRTTDVPKSEAYNLGVLLKVHHPYLPRPRLRQGSFAAMFYYGTR